MIYLPGIHVSTRKLVVACMFLIALTVDDAFHVYPAIT